MSFRSPTVTSRSDPHKTKRYSPDELQYQFILEMASAVNSLPMTKEVEVNMFKFDQTRACTRPAELNVMLAMRKPKVIKAPASPEVVSAALPLRESTASIKAEEEVVDLTVAITEEPETASSQVARVLNIDDFQFIRLLGQGMECKVFLALDTPTEKLFAIKVVPKNGLTPKAHTRLFEEQRVQKALTNSPWALELEASFEDTDNFYFVSVRYSQCNVIGSSDPLHRTIALVAPFPRGLNEVAT